MDNIKIEALEFHICHKCGLIRWITPDVGSSFVKKEGLGYCVCMGRTTFSYEEKSRTIEEARGIAKKIYLARVELYKEQGREEYEFERLKEEYRMGGN